MMAILNHKSLHYFIHRIRIDCDIHNSFWQGVDILGSERISFIVNINFLQTETSFSIALKICIGLGYLFFILF